MSSHSDLIKTRANGRNPEESRVLFSRFAYPRRTPPPSGSVGRSTRTYSSRSEVTIMGDAAPAWVRPLAEGLVLSRDLRRPAAGHAGSGATPHVAEAPLSLGRGRGLRHRPLLARSGPLVDRRCAAGTAAGCTPQGMRVASALARWRPVACLGRTSSSETKCRGTSVGAELPAGPGLARSLPSDCPQQDHQLPTPTKCVHQCLCRSARQCASDR